MSSPNPLSILIPEHTRQKLEELQEHYCLPADIQVQKIVVDRVDDLHEAVILAPRRKEKEA